MAQLMAQAIGSAAVVSATLVAAVVVMYAVKATGTLRVSAAGELEGLDLHEHGMVSYPEYVIHDSSMVPQYMTPVTSAPFAVPVKAKAEA
jgi:ammonium transporter, Amt family